ncbi:MAG: hypothetical protein HXY25_10840 [Alphaproteobacteria bacterium]|nr:hypothetical protein [Alphaproteobacteria bacterium]
MVNRLQGARIIGAGLLLAAGIAGAAFAQDGGFTVEGCVASVKGEYGGATPEGMTDETLTAACTCLGEQIAGKPEVEANLIETAPLPAAERDAARSEEAKAAVAACFTPAE